MQKFKKILCLFKILTCNLKAETISKFFYRLANCSYDVTARFLTPLDLFYYLVFGFWFKIGVNIYFSQVFNLQCLSVRESNRLVEFVETRFKYITLNLVGVYLIIFQINIQNFIKTLRGATGVSIRETRRNATLCVHMLIPRNIINSNKHS